MKVTQKKYLTTKECGELMGRSVGAIRNLVMRRKIPFRKVGGRLLFLYSEIVEWIENSEGNRYYPGVPLNGEDDLSGSTDFIRKMNFLDRPIRRFVFEHPPCIYLLLRRNTVVYVGQTTILTGRIADHKTAREKDFDEVYYIPAPKNELGFLEERFIRFLRPEYNKSMKEEG